MAQTARRDLARRPRPEPLEKRRPSGHHPYPGTHPTVVTRDRDWGGWRVPGSEYDLDPFRVERQAKIIVRAPVFRKLLEEFVQHAEQEPENLSDDLVKLAQLARRVISETAE